jgi:hypothetical protein
VAILSVDLAYRRWSDLGIVVLDRADPGAHLAQPSEAAAGGSSTVPQTAAFSGHTARSRRSGWPITCEIIPSMTPGDERGPVDANVLAGRLNHLCTVRDMRVIMLDGPQAWKSSLNGLQHSRVSERQLNTAAKTGLPGMVKPVTYRAFAEFCLDVYDALCRRGWRRLETKEQPGAAAERVLVESYPHAAWKSLGLKPLPADSLYDKPAAQSRSAASDCGWIAGLALEERNAAGARIVGNPPRREDGHWREGFIVLPVAPNRQAGVGWVDSLRWLD